MSDEFRKRASTRFVLLWYLITSQKLLLTAGISSSVSGKSHIPLLFSPSSPGKEQDSSTPISGLEFVLIFL